MPFFFQCGFMTCFSPGARPGKISRYRVRRRSSGFIPKIASGLSNIVLKTVRATGFSGICVFQEKLLRTVLVRDGLLVGIVRPNGGLDARATLIAHQAGTRSRVGRVVRHPATTVEQ